MSRPIQARIFTHHLRHNLAVVKELTQQRPTWAVVKADAYGHGLKAALRALRASEGIALLNVEHATRARALGWVGKILLLEGIFCAQEMTELAHLRCDMVIHHEPQVTWLIEWLSQQSAKKQTEVLQHCALWLKLNSGMNRLGFKSAQYGVSYEILRNMGFTVNHMTHFANADDPKGAPSVASQWEIFCKATQFYDGLHTAANSAAILQHPLTHADMTRPGIMLYGAAPSGIYQDIATIGLKAGMSLRSEIIALQDLQVGDCVGYGGQFQASVPLKIAVIACGYADGYPRLAPNGTPVWVSGEQGLARGAIAPIVGRVSMDMITIDVTHLTHARVGLAVELWGEYVPIDTVAQPAQTVGYELMCGLAPRVPVIVIDE